MLKVLSLISRLHIKKPGVVISALGGGGKWIPRAHSLIYLMCSRPMRDPAPINSWTAPEEQQQSLSLGLHMPEWTYVYVRLPTHPTCSCTWISACARTCTCARTHTKEKKKILFSNTVPWAVNIHSEIIQKEQQISICLRHLLPNATHQEDNLYLRHDANMTHNTKLLFHGMLFCVELSVKSSLWILF